MTIKVLAFGIAREIFGGSFTEIEAQGDTLTASACKTMLEEKYPRLKSLSSFMLAVNNEYAHGGEMITVRDEVAVIPPVSGG